MANKVENGWHESCRIAIQCLKGRGWRFYLPVSLQVDAMKFWDDLVAKKQENPENEYDDELRQYMIDNGFVKAWDCTDVNGEPLDPRSMDDFHKQDVDDWHLLFRAFFAKIVRLDVPN